MTQLYLSGSSAACAVPPTAPRCFRALNSACAYGCSQHFSTCLVPKIFKGLRPREPLIVVRTVVASHEPIAVADFSVNLM
jgi:hypothetical protein